MQDQDYNDFLPFEYTYKLRLLSASAREKMRKFLIKTIIALVLITAGTLIRGEIVLGGEDCLAMALLIWGLVEEVQHVNSR